jgi:hypothetical protein
MTDERSEAGEGFVLRQKLGPLTDNEHIVWAREAVRRDVKTALLNIESPEERRRLFEVLQQLLNRMKAKPDNPGSDGLTRLR